ncbi:MAG: MinD/ParA family protein, partial [Pirellulaceae bacterium]
VNLADEPVARDVHQRIRQSCERFLGHGIDLLGWVPGDRYVGEAAQQSTPFVLLSPTSAGSQAVHRLAQELAAGDRRNNRPAALAG